MLVKMFKVNKLLVKGKHFEHTDNLIYLLNNGYTSEQSITSCMYKNIQYKVCFVWCREKKKT